MTDCAPVLAGAHLSPHHAAAGSDAAVSPVLSFPLPALPEPQQPPRSAEPGDAVSAFSLTLKQICFMGLFFSVCADNRLVRREKSIQMLILANLNV